MPSAGAKSSHVLPGISKTIAGVNERLGQLAEKDTPVFITGEAGTEKAFAAKIIHQLSNRADRAVAKVNVTWKLPPDIGDRFRMCHEGTLIISLQREFPVDMQYTLLEMADDKAFADPISGELVEADVRIIVTTSTDLATLRRKVQLLPELSEYLRDSHVEIPPIRTRTEDIPALVRYATQRAVETGRSRVRAADAQVLALFRLWDWPGNAEDLLLVTAEAALNTQRDVITLDDMPGEFLESVPEELIEQARQVRLPRSAPTTASGILTPPPQEMAPAPAGREPETEPLPAQPSHEDESVHEEVHAVANEAEPAARKSPTSIPRGPLSDEEVDEQARRLHRLFTLARRLNTQSQVLAEQMTGPVRRRFRQSENEDAQFESPFEISQALEQELDKGLDAVLGLRRQLAVLNEREQKAVQTARDLYRRLIIAGETSRKLMEDQEVLAETQELAGDLKHIDDIIQRISGRIPKMEFAPEHSESEPNPLHQEEIRAIASILRRAEEAERQQALPLEPIDPFEKHPHLRRQTPIPVDDEAGGEAARIKSAEIEPVPDIPEAKPKAPPPQESPDAEQPPIPAPPAEEAPVPTEAREVPKLEVPEESEEETELSFQYQSILSELPAFLDDSSEEETLAGPAKPRSDLSEAKTHPLGTGHDLSDEATQSLNEEETQKLREAADRSKAETRRRDPEDEQTRPRDPSKEDTRPLSGKRPRTPDDTAPLDKDSVRELVRDAKKGRKKKK